MKSLESASKATANRASAVQRVAQPRKVLVNNRPHAIAQHKLQEHINNRSQPVAQRQPAPVIQMVSMETVMQVAQHFGVTIVQSTSLDTAVALISAATGLSYLVTYGIITVGLALGAPALIGKLLHRQNADPNTVTIHVNNTGENSAKDNKEKEGEDEAAQKILAEQKSLKQQARKQRLKERRAQEVQSANGLVVAQEAGPIEEEEQDDEGEWAVVDRSRAPRAELTDEERYQNRLDQTIDAVDRELRHAMNFPMQGGVRIGPRYDVDADLRQDVYDYFNAMHNQPYAGYFLYIVRGNKNPPHYYNIALHTKVNPDNSTTMANLHINN